MSNRVKATPRPGTPSGDGRPARSPFLVPALVVLGVFVALVIVVSLVGGGDDGEATDLATGAAYGPVSVEGAALPGFDDPADDPAVGTAAPRLLGQDLDGASVEVGPGRPTILAFLAHWCPHCQRELPLLVEVSEAGGFDGVRMVAVLTGTNPDAPNFPPGAWLEREGWTGDVVLDDDATTAAKAFGLAGYPFLVVLDADGNVVARTSGELPKEQLEALADAAREGA